MPGGVTMCTTSGRAASSIAVGSAKISASPGITALSASGSAVGSTTPTMMALGVFIAAR